MKGIVFTGFLEMVDEVFSPEITECIIESSNLKSGGIYTAVGTYDYTEIGQALDISLEGGER